MIQIQGLDRVDLTHKLDDVRQRIAAIENKFGIGGDFQTALESELNKGIIAQSQQVAPTQNISDAKKLLGGTQPVNEADAINSAKVAAALNAINKNSTVQNPVQNPAPVQQNNSAKNPATVQQNNPAQKTFPGAEALPGKIMQTNPAAENPAAAISPATSPKTAELDESVFESDAEDRPAISTPEIVSAKVQATAAKYGVNPKLAEAVAIAENGLSQEGISDAGAIGVMQLMPETAVSLGVDPYDEDENIEGGVRYLNQLLERFDGNVELAVAAYNAGPNAVKEYGGVPPYKETQAYVQRVMSLYQ